MAGSPGDDGSAQVKENQIVAALLRLTHIMSRVPRVIRLNKIKTPD